MTNENAKYAALITVFAILVTVIYANGKFDLWDCFVGFIGLIFGLKFIKEIDEKDLFLCLLVGSLISISLIPPIYLMLESGIKDTMLGNSLIIFLPVTIVLTIVLYLISKQKKK